MLTEAASVTRNDVIAALRQASAETGSDFQFVLGTAVRESGLKPEAKSSSSSATGLFQFVEQTWLGLVKQTGTRYGLGSYAAAISQGSDGRYCVDNRDDRQAILALRNNPQVSALMEGKYVKQARNTLENSLGRSVCNGELYAAHFLGAESACRLIRLNEREPGASAASAFPQAADTNRSVFYHTDGSAKSVREVYDWALKQTKAAAHIGGEKAASAPAPRTPVGQVSASPSRLVTSWMTAELLAGTSPLVSLNSLRQAPFVVTPGVIDLLGSLSTPGASSSAHAQLGI